MRTLKLVGAASFSCAPMGIVAAKLGSKVVVQNDDDAEYLLSKVYVDPANNELPLFSANLDAPRIFKRKTVTMSMLDAVRSRNAGAKRSSGGATAKKTRTRPAAAA